MLATKLFAPRPPAGFVPRPRLVERLDAGLPGGLTLVCAPAGFGKTALVTDWARSRPVAWLRLDVADNDPTRFWRHVLAALDAVRPGIAERVEPVLGPPAPLSMQGPVTLLINDLASGSEQREIVLVLDDYQDIESRTVHESLTFLLDHLPPRLRLVVLSRVDPPLPMARLRAAGWLVELRAQDLRFSLDEAGALLRATLRQSLPSATIAALATRTEGWAAGLRLAGLSLQGRADAEVFVQAFSGSHRYVLDYLTEEVLERQPQAIRRFLLESSVLDRLSGELCDAVTGRTDGRSMLDAIDRANLFVVPLDDVREWWRYHQLFADLLRARLQHESPDHVPELHRNAAGWYERHGLVDDAIRHALAAEDAGWAARIIEREVDGFLLRNEEVTLERCLAALPADVVASRPRLLLAQGDRALSRGDIEAVERALDSAERVVAKTSDEVYEPSVGLYASLLVNVPAAIAYWRAYLAELRGDVDGALAHDRRALAELGDAESLLASVVGVHLRTAGLVRGELREAERDIRSTIAPLQTAGQIYPAMRSIELLGHIQRARGRLDAAVETYRWGLDIAVASGRAPPPSAGIAHAGLAEVAYQRGELDIALEHATRAITLCHTMAYRRPMAAAVATLARVRCAQSGPADGLAALGQDPRVATSLGVTNLLNPIPALRARLMLASGDLAQAIRWAKDRGLGADDEVSYPREPEYLVLARVLLAQDRRAQALALLDRLHALADRQERVGSVLEIEALRSVALAAAGDAAGALTTLSAALALGHPQGYLRVFVDEGAPMRALMIQFIAAQRDDDAWAHHIPLGYLGRLMRAFGSEQDRAETHDGRRGIGVPGLVAPLSERELEVLRLVIAGKPNQEIAAELFVALDTVKKHVSHILAKLGATNRTEATGRARELGLIDDAAEPRGSARSRA